MKKKFLLIIIIVVSLLMIVSCSPKTPQELRKFDVLPIDATNIEDHGNGWFTFTKDGKQFLFFVRFSGYKGYSAVTQIK